MDQEDPDLTGVHPLLWEKTRARIAAIKEYLNLDPPHPEEEERLARQVGLSVPHFRRLARTWLRYKRADMLPGTSFNRVVHPAYQQRLATEAEAIVEQVIADLGERADVPDIAAEVSRRCAKNGVVAPHPITIRQRVEKAWITRDVRLEAHADPALVIDHCAVDLPTRTEQGLLMLPIVSLAILVPELTIIAHSIALHTPSPQASAGIILAALQASTPGTPVRPVKMGQGRTGGWRDLGKLLKRSGVAIEGRTAVQVPSARTLTKLIGHELGDLTLRPNLTHRPAAITRQSIREIRAEDLSAAIAQAIADHNRTRGAGGSAVRFRITLHDTAYLTARLGRIAAKPLESPRPRPRYDALVKRINTRLVENNTRSIE
ncbi:MAG TPA: hypothetical protein VF605_19595 [Allosphingosinicella sp.]|jgi:AraC-like DNA-binding protein